MMVQAGHYIWILKIVVKPLESPNYVALSRTRAGRGELGELCSMCVFSSTF